jgi:hypothetical protein
VAPYSLARFYREMLVAGGSNLGAIRTSQARTAWMTWLRRDGHAPVYHPRHCVAPFIYLSMSRFECFTCKQIGI